VSRIQGEQQYSFKHGLIRQVAYSSVPRVRRRERHAVVARFLEETTTKTGESAATLGFHWREAGAIERALEYYVAAADHAGRLPEGDERRRTVAAKRAVAFQALYHVPDAASLARRVER